MPKGRVSASRSRNMSAIRGKDTGPELLVRRAIHAAGFKYRLHRRDLPGTPDLVFPKLKAVLFVNGCFWHYHECSQSTLPRVRAEFWSEKLRANRRRDGANHIALIRAGWRVRVLWECQLARGACYSAIRWLRNIEKRARRPRVKRVITNRQRS